LWPEFDWLGPVLSAAEDAAQAYGRALTHARKALDTVRQIGAIVDRAKGEFYQQHRDDASSFALGSVLGAFEEVQRYVIRQAEYVVDSVYGDLRRWQGQLAGSIGGHVGFIRDTLAIRPGSSDAWKVGVRIGEWLPRLQGMVPLALAKARDADSIIGAVTRTLKNIPPWVYGATGVAGVALLLGGLSVPGGALLFQPPADSGPVLGASVKYSVFADPFVSRPGSAEPSSPLQGFRDLATGAVAAFLAAAAVFAIRTRSFFGEKHPWPQGMDSPRLHAAAANLSSSPNAAVRPWARVVLESESLYYAPPRNAWFNASGVTAGAGLNASGPLASLNVSQSSLGLTGRYSVAPGTWNPAYSDPRVLAWTPELANRTSPEWQARELSAGIAAGTVRPRFHSALRYGIGTSALINGASFAMRRQDACDTWYYLTKDSISMFLAVSAAGGVEGGGALLGGVGGGLAGGAVGAGASFVTRNPGYAAAGWRYGSTIGAETGTVLSQEYAAWTGLVTFIGAESFIQTFTPKAAFCR
jgi:hypothetical protein